MPIAEKLPGEGGALLCCWKEEDWPAAVARVRRGSGSMVFDTGFGLKVTFRGGLGRGSLDCGGCCGSEDDG